MTKPRTRSNAPANAPGVPRQRPAQAPQKQEEVLPLEEAQRLLNDLRIHEIELELQNEELRQTQVELAAARARYFELYELAPAGYVTLDERGFIRETNLTATMMVGIGRATWMGKRISLFVHKDYQDVFYMRTKRIFELGTLESWEMQMVTSNGSSLWTLWNGTLAQDGNGADVCRIVISDINERKKAEQENIHLAAQLQQAQKMESVGRLAGGVAHEFNNMLAVILGHLDVAFRCVETNHPLYVELEEIRLAALRSANVTRQLLGFARKQVVVPQPLDLNVTVTAMMQMLPRLIGENIRIHWQQTAQLWTTWVDPSQIEQVLTNLCINARDAIVGVGSIYITTSNCTFEAGKVIGDAQCPPGDYVSIAVSDDGKGMNAATRAHIFEAFFTTKGVDKGSGLGLAMVYGIIKQNHGFIDVTSQIGKGTTITMYWPRYLGNVQPTCPQVEEKTLPGGTETILIVEDERAVMRAVARILKQLGYHVLEATGPTMALALAAESDREIHLVLTDVIMPEMDGRQLTDRLRAAHPTLKCVFMSGYSAEFITYQNVLEDGMHFIHKPFTTHELAAIIRCALDEKTDVA